MRLLPLACLLISALAASGRAQDEDAPRLARIDALVDALEARLGEAPHPGAAVAVLRRGEPIWFRGTGCAQIENEIPITRASTFRLASTSKQFTAAAIALLESRGELDLDADLKTWFPAFADHGHGITVRHLVHHTSGLRDYLWLHFMEGIRDEDVVSPRRSLAMIERQRALEFEPGTRFAYSNSNYLLLAEIVARVSGRSFRGFVEEEIFAPLGMKTARVCDDRDRILPRRTAGYARARGGWRRAVTPLEHVGDGGVFASIDDLARWDAHFYAPTLGRAGDLVARQRRTGPFEGYAFGLVRETWRGLEVEMHGGAFAGYRAELMRFPAEGLSFVCLGNHASFDATGLAFAMAAAWFGDRLEAPEEKTPGPRDEEPATAAADEAPLPAGLAPRLAGAWSCAEFELPCRLAHRDGTLGLHFGKNRLFLGHAGGARFRAGEFEVEFLLAGDEVLGFTLRRGAQPPHVYRPRPAGAD